MVYCHLLIGRSKSLLIDTGMSYSPEQNLLPYMQSVGLDPETLDYVLITHSDVDHQGGNDLIRNAAPHAQFMAHTLDTPWIEDPNALISGRYNQFQADHGIGLDAKGVQDMLDVCRSNTPMDIQFEGNEVIRLAPDWHVQLIYTPGHTWGHTAVYDPDSKTLIAAEAALFNTIWGMTEQPALPPTYCYVDLYLATLERCAQWIFKLILPRTGLCKAGMMSKRFWMKARRTVYRSKQKC